LGEVRAFLRLHVSGDEMEIKKTAERKEGKQKDGQKKEEDSEI